MVNRQTQVAHQQYAPVQQPTVIEVSLNDEVTIESTGNDDVRHTTITGTVPVRSPYQEAASELFDLRGPNQGLTYNVQLYNNLKQPEVDVAGPNVQAFRSTSFSELTIKTLGGETWVSITSRGVRRPLKVIKPNKSVTIMVTNVAYILTPYIATYKPQPGQLETTPGHGIKPYPAAKGLSRQSSNNSLSNMVFGR